MMTPQEVASHAFAKATLGGYNMAMVDEFLDLLTEDYTALYNDNAILKNKLKVLSETVEEYRATDTAMRKTLLAAQQMAEAMVSDAEKKKNELVHDAEAAAQTRLNELKQQITDEEYRLQKAKEATAAYGKTGGLVFLRCSTGSSASPIPAVRSPGLCRRLPQKSLAGDKRLPPQRYPDKHAKQAQAFSPSRLGSGPDRRPGPETPGTQRRPQCALPTYLKNP